MTRRFLITVAAVALAAGIAYAQDTPAAQAGKKPEPAVASTSRGAGQLANVRIDLTITEERGGPTLPAKSVTMLVADREFGRVRTGQGNALLNADARPEILPNGRIRVALSLEYRRPQEESDKLPPPLLTESLAMILDDGKPQVISQSADPGAAPGAVRVEVKATISK